MPFCVKRGIAFYTWRCRRYFTLNSCPKFPTRALIILHIFTRNISFGMSILLCDREREREWGNLLTPCLTCARCGVQSREEKKSASNFIDRCCVCIVFDTCEKALINYEVFISPLLFRALFKFQSWLHCRRFYITHSWEFFYPAIKLAINRYEDWISHALKARRLIKSCVMLEFYQLVTLLVEKARRFPVIFWLNIKLNLLVVN